MYIFFDGNPVKPGVPTGGNNGQPLAPGDPQPPPPPGGFGAGATVEGSGCGVSSAHAGAFGPFAVLFAALMLGWLATRRFR